MCFSATASFTAGAILSGIGTLTLRSALSAHRPRELAFATIPLLFAVQQFTEGLIWLSFNAGEPFLIGGLTHVYSFFSHVLWPVYVPVAVMWMEPAGWRRRALCGFVAAGAGVAAFLLFVLVVFPVVARPVDQHIEYLSPHFFAALTMLLYLSSTVLSPVFSSHRWVQVFGVLALLSFGSAYGFYARWFISVWCFFAALLSAVIYLHFALRGMERASPLRPVAGPASTR